MEHAIWGLVSLIVGVVAFTVGQGYADDRQYDDGFVAGRNSGRVSGWQDAFDVMGKQPEDKQLKLPFYPPHADEGDDYHTAYDERAPSPR